MEDGQAISHQPSAISHDSASSLSYAVFANT
jgi:hypothetical protein